MPFCHLHVHSQYSILDSSLSIACIAKAAKAFAMKSVALTDHGNLFGAIEFYKAMKEAGVHPIIGCEMALAEGSRLEKKKSSAHSHIVLLAKTIKGYKNLCKLSSWAYTQGFYYVPRIDKDLLKEHAEDLICLSGCDKGPFAEFILQDKKKELAEEIDWFTSTFKDDFYFEIARHVSSREDLEAEGITNESWLYRQYQEHVAKEKILEAFLLEESKRRSIPCVATNNCHYYERKDWKAHEILLNIQSGEPCLLREENPHTGIPSSTPNPKRSTLPSHEYYFKSPEEMRSLFADIPEALDITTTIADKCHLEIDFVSKHYPVYSIKEEGETKTWDRQKAAEDYLKQLSYDGIAKRYSEERLQKVAEAHPGRDPHAVVKERLEFELDIIISKGLADYFLLVWDFISWAKQHKIPVGPGRGSVVGSIVAYLIGITDIEPLRFHLFFERFINPGRMSYPDIDVDLCMERRPEVIAYTMEKYGKENVAQIITFGTMKAKMSIRDVGRALNVPLSKVNQIVKLVPDDLNITIEKALEKDQDLKSISETDEDATAILQAAQVLEGSIRNTGIHAAGIIVCGDPLYEHIPICTAKDAEMYVSQYSMKPVEQVGMLKVDFLGLKTLTSIQLCVDALKKYRHITIDCENIPLEDEAAFHLLDQGQTLGVFQIEDGGMQDLSRQLHLDKFEEIIAMIALYRPGPMEMIPSFIARKHGTEPIEYDHPKIESILKETYGIMVYQEQIMQIAQELASFSLSEGDVLRRAMGKKDAKEMAKQRKKFIEGAVKNEISEEIAASIFSKMERFAEYGFNKSHAAAYGYITYTTAYLKAHYPGEWLAALMTCDKDDTEKVARLMHEAQQLKIPCLPPDINDSEMAFRATSEGIRFALSAIKGMGTQVVESICEERQNRPYSSLYDFVHRIDPKKVGKKAIELLIDAGCFDRFSWTRDECLATLELMYDEVQKTKKDQERGIFSLFDTALEGAQKAYTKPIRPKITRSEEDLLLREKALLGLFVRGHPLTIYQKQLHSLCCLPFKEASRLAEGSVFRMAFVVETVAIKFSSKSKKKFAILSLSDAQGDVLEMPIWPELYEASQELLIENKMLFGVFSKEKRENDITLSCRWLGDVKAMNQALIEESYTAYEKAKAQAAFAKKPYVKKGTTQPKQKASQEESTSLEIKIDLAKFRASHVLTLTKLLPKTPGKDKVSILFFKDDGEVASLQLPQIQLESSFEKDLAKLPSIKV